VIFVVAGTAAWAPGLENKEAWSAWSRAPRAITGTAVPEVRFLPPLVRRRCSRLTRVLLQAAHDCLGESYRESVPSVFASRHGDCAGALEIMTELAAYRPLTAGAFSHSVHNTAAGLYSIATGNTAPSSTTAGARDTFGSAIIEGLGLLRRTRAERVLVVVGDEPLPDDLGQFTSEPTAPYAVALLIARHGEGQTVRCAAGGSDAPSRPWPHAVEFLRWLYSDETSLTTGAVRNRLTWMRDR